MGTPAFAATILGALIEAGHRILAVYTQPPRPAGRGHRPQPSPVQSLAVQQGLPVRCPGTLRNEAEQAAFAALGADAAVVAAYGLILPRPILTAPRLGCLNVHASLLPRWRGAAPIQRALLAGDRETGITIMQMEEGLDTGPILLQETIPIAPNATSDGLSAELAILGGRLMLTALDGVAEGRLVGTPQPQQGVTYAPKIGREEGRLDWRLHSTDLERRVRAFDPWPGSFFETRRREDPRARGGRSAGSGGRRAGHGARRALDRCVRRGRLCACLRLQRPGRATLEAPEFLRGFPIPPGTRLPCPATS